MSWVEKRLEGICPGWKNDWREYVLGVKNDGREYVREGMFPYPVHSHCYFNFSSE